MTISKALPLALIAALLSGCGSTSDPLAAAKGEKGFELMVRQRLAGKEGLEIGEPFIYREGDRRSGCVIASWSNQWNERQPEVIVRGDYNPADRQWYPAGWMEETKGLTCEQYVDPAHLATMEKADEDERNAKFEAMQREANKQTEGMQQEQVRAEAEQREAIERADAEGRAQSEAASAKREAEEQARQKAADEALQNSLLNGPTGPH
jgi:hypothetical protein